MANSYTRLYIHIIFVVKFRERLIHAVWKDRLEQYITGIVREKGHKMLQINCQPDHVHIFIGLKPHEAISDLVRDVKRDSTNFINSRGLAPGRFLWQNGFSAFSHSPDAMRTVINYIKNQEEHHRKRTFRAEYLEFLKEYEIEYDLKYVFADPE